MNKFDEFKQKMIDRYDSLTKSSFNDFELVIFAVFTDENEGWGHHCFNGVGINEKGNLYWCFSSGCSCSGSCSAEETTVKVLAIKNMQEFEEFMQRIENEDFEDIIEGIQSFNFADYE